MYSKIKTMLHTASPPLPDLQPASRCHENHTNSLHCLQLYSPHTHTHTYTLSEIQHYNVRIQPAIHCQIYSLPAVTTKTTEPCGLYYLHLQPACRYHENYRTMQPLLPALTACLPLPRKLQNHAASTTCIYSLHGGIPKTTQQAL